MSASRERKERANNKTVAQPKKQEKKKVSEGLILAISVILILVAVFGTILGIRYYQQNQTVMTVGDKDITVKEFNHFFNQTASTFSENYGSYASYLGMDTTRAIDAQNINADSLSYMSLFGMDIECLEPYKQEDGSYDITWAGYFALQAKETAAQVWSVYQAAMADKDYNVPEEIETGIQNELLNLDFYARIYGMSTDKFIEAQYGDGCNEETYEQHIRVSYVASDYAANYWFSNEDIDSKYNAATADFDVVTFMAYSVSSSEFLSTEEAEETVESEETTDTEETTEEDTAAQEEAKAQAKAAAEAMEASFDETAENVSTYADYTIASAKSYTTDEAGTWLFETANVGDVKLFANEDGTTYYVVKLLANDVNYLTGNYLQIFIAADEETSETTEDHEGHDHEEGEEETATTAAEKLEAVKAGLESDGSEENFRTLASEYNSESSVDLEDVAYSYLESYISTDALLWTLEGRQAGDYQVFENTNGTYILYYVGASENTYRNLSVNSALVTEWVNTMTETTIENCGFDMDAAMNGAVALMMNSGSET